MKSQVRRTIPRGARRISGKVRLAATRLARQVEVRTAIMELHLPAFVRGRRHFQRLKRPVKIDSRPTRARARTRFAFTRTSRLTSLRMRRDLHIIETRWLTNRPSRVSLRNFAGVTFARDKSCAFSFSPLFLSQACSRKIIAPVNCNTARLTRALHDVLRAVCKTL